jgi:HSP20 family protein
MERGKRPSIFDLVERYMERALEEMQKLPAPTEEELTRAMKREEQSIDEWFKDPFEEMLKQLETELPEAYKGLIKETPEGKIRRYGPFIYGFACTKEPGKEPEIKEFGNIKPSDRRLAPFPNGEREPLVDIIDQNDAYEVVAELPGVEKRDIKLHATEDALEIKTVGDVSFYKHIAFETRVKPKTATATYRNGVLSVRLEKRADTEQNRTAIPVE